MYTFVRTQPWQRLLAEQAPTLMASLLVAEFFYKFGSFLLEAVAFLATWFAMDVVLQLSVNAARSSRSRLGS